MKTKRVCLLRLFRHKKSVNEDFFSSSGLNVFLKTAQCTFKFVPTLRLKREHFRGDLSVKNKKMRDRQADRQIFAGRREVKANRPADLGSFRAQQIR